MSVKATNGEKVLLGSINNHLTRIELDANDQVKELITYAEFEYTISSAVFADDNEIIALYYNTSSDSLESYVAKFDSQLNLDWIFKIPVKNLLQYYFENYPRPVITITGNNDIIVKVVTEQNKSDNVLRLNTDGELLWKTKLPDFSSFTINPNVLELRDGNLFTTSGRNSYFLNSEGEIILTTSQANVKSDCALLNDSTIISVSFYRAHILSSEGRILDSLELESERRVKQVIADDGGGFLTVSEYNPSRIFTRYDSELNMLWSEKVDIDEYGLAYSNGIISATGSCRSHVALAQFDAEEIPNQYLFLLSPNGGEQLPENYLYINSIRPDNSVIEWASKNVGAITIEFSPNNGSDWEVLAEKYPGEEKQFKWDLPVIESEECLIRISSPHYAGANDVSRLPFSVQPYTSIDYIAGNEIKMWIGNNGMSSRDPYNDNSGFFWPGGEDAVITAIFSDGILWGGKVNDEIRVNGATYRFGLTPGAILDNGEADDPLRIENKVFKLKKNWQSLPPGKEYNKYKYNYENWPALHGAPYTDVNGDGIFTKGVDTPLILGDETLFYVANDLDEETTAFTYGSNPIGLEFQQTLFAYNAPELKDAVFKKIRLINKSDNNIDSMYIGYWADYDLGFANDDYVGVDTLLDLGYCYNGDNYDDDYYLDAPPAAGHLLLQGPIVQSAGDTAIISGQIKVNNKNLALNSSSLYIGSSATFSDPALGNYKGSINIYNNMRGLFWDGTPVIDPHTSEKITFCVPGDPVNGTGWYEGDGWPGGTPPADRRYAISTGPFTMAPGDTQEVVYAIFMARGSDNINSVAKLKEKAIELHEFWDSGIATDVEETDIQIPAHFSLSQNYPNPFNPTTTIEYKIPSLSPGERVSEGRVRVKLVIYDILGREVATLVDEQQIPGKYWVKFDGNNSGSGIYFYRLTAGDFTKTQKMILLK